MFCFGRVTGRGVALAGATLTPVLALTVGAGGAKPIGTTRADMLCAATEAEFSGNTLFLGVAVGHSLFVQ